MSDTRDALFIPSDYRQNFKNILAKRSDLVQLDGARLAPSLAPVVLYAGQVLGLAASGGDAGYWKPYNSANTDGSEVARGVLMYDAVIDAAGNGTEAAIAKEGVFFQSLLVGLDAGAITALGGHSFVEHGDTLIRIRA